MLTVADKNPALVEAGRRGARARWGEPRTVRLDELTPEQRHLVVALIDAAKKAPAVAESASALEVSRADTRPTPTREL